MDLHAAETSAVQLLFPFDASCFHSTSGPQHCPLSNGLGAPPEFPLPTRRLVQADLIILSRSNWTPPRCAKTCGRSRAGVCFSRHLSLQWPFLQRKHLFSSRRRARRSLGVPSLSVETVDCCGGCRGCPEPFTRFRACLREEKNPRSFRAVFLRSWAPVPKCVCVVRSLRQRNPLPPSR